MLAFLIQYGKILSVCKRLKIYSVGENKMKTKLTEKKRIFFLDELRGFAVACMVFYHAFYILSSMYGYAWAEKLYYFFMPVQPFFAGLFVFICGISCSLSRSNAKRGFIILGAAAIITVATAVVMPKLGFVECEIYFGILHLLSVCVLSCALLEKPLKKVSPFVGILICAVLYPFADGISTGVLSYGDLIVLEIPSHLYENNYLAPLGIYSPSFFSADYFPVFPDIFIFFAGVFAGRHFKTCGFAEWTYTQRAKLFGVLGRNALIVYIAHMPLIYALTELVRLIIK